MECEIARPFQATESDVSLLRVHLSRPTSVRNVELDGVQEGCVEDYVVVFDGCASRKSSR